MSLKQISETPETAREGQKNARRQTENNEQTGNSTSFFYK